MGRIVGSSQVRENESHDSKAQHGAAQSAQDPIFARRNTHESTIIQTPVARSVKEQEQEETESATGTKDFELVLIRSRIKKWAQ